MEKGSCFEFKNNEGIFSKFKQFIEEFLRLKSVIEVGFNEYRSDDNVENVVDYGI